MGLNEWWKTDPSQRYWMEATARPDLGDDLRAPKGGSIGQPVWHYDLVSLVKPGEIVFHWHTSLMGHPALVGWSRVVGELHEGLHPWRPHAGPGRAAYSDQPIPNWVVPLAPIHFLDKPIFSADIRPERQTFLDIKSDLTTRFKGSLYFPFAKYGVDQLRASEAYLTKFPQELVTFLDARFGLELEGLSEDDSLLGEIETKPIRSGSGQGFLRDTQRKIAVELHAVDRAKEMYKALGATEIVVLGKPYDLRVTLNGEEIHVEVKGSGNEVEAVQVTKNEVEHARQFARTELVVVDRIRWDQGAAGTQKASGGRLRHWSKWEVHDESLTAITYRHHLAGGESVSEDTD